MRIDIWSDIVCPWCYIGKRRLEATLEHFPHADQVEVAWRAFQLDPSLPTVPGPTAIEVMAGPGGDPAPVRARFAQITRLGAAEGLDLRLTTAYPVDTLAAHRLSAWALTRGRQSAVMEQLLLAYHTENRNIADHGVLVDVARSAGLAADEAQEVLAGEWYTDEVRADLAEARQVGAYGVPTFVVNGQKVCHGPPEVAALLDLLNRVARAASTRA